MTDFKDIVKKRRSIRKFSDEKISDEDMKLIPKGEKLARLLHIRP